MGRNDATRNGGRPARSTAVGAVRQVREALAHLHDAAALQSVRLSGVTPTIAGTRDGVALQRALVEALRELCEGGAGRGPLQRLLALRYLDGLSPRAACARLSVSKSTHYREHQRAVAALAAYLRDQLVSRSIADGAPPAPPVSDQSADDDELERVVGVLDRARALLEDGLPLGRRLDDPDAVATTLRFIANLSEAAGDRDRAEEHSRESLGIRRIFDLTASVARVLCELGALGRRRPEPQRARPWLDEALSLVRRVGIRSCTGRMVLSERADVATETGEIGLAGALAREFMGLCRAVGDRGSAAGALRRRRSVGARGRGAVGG